MAYPSNVQQLRHHQLLVVRSFPLRLGSTVRTHGRTNDSRTCHEHRIPNVGLDMDLEYHWECRCKSTKDVWEVTCSFGCRPESILSLHRSPIIQTSTLNTALLVYATLLISLVSYGRFCTLVIGDITNHLGIACFTVRKRGNDGVWKDVVGDAPATREQEKKKKSKGKGRH